MTSARWNEFTRLSGLKRQRRRAETGPDGRDGRADPALAEAEALLAASGELVTWHDKQGDVVRTVGSVSTAPNLKGAVLKGIGFFERVHIPDRPAFLKALSDAANGSGPVRVELRLTDCGSGAASGKRAGRPGDLVWVEMRAQALRQSSSDAVVLAFFRDASVSRRHGEELESARIEAVRANELKGKFLATVSHELRTPLNAIIGFSELLCAEHPYVMAEERRKEYAAIIRDSGRHLLEVVNTLLDMSKIESGNFNFAPEPFDIVGLAESVCDLMRLKAEQAGVTLRRSLAPNLPEILADPRACRQILINLLSNALKFTQAGGMVTVALWREGDRIVLGVSDDGIGIRESDLPRLGNPFFQAGDVHCRSVEGTGLGLSVVRGLVGLHRGSLAIESGLGCGTGVTVGLPIDGTTAPMTSNPATLSTRIRRVRPLDRKSA